MDEIEFKVESGGVEIAGTLILSNGDALHPAVAWMGGRGGFSRQARSYMGRARGPCPARHRGDCLPFAWGGASGRIHPATDLFDRADDAEAVNRFAGRHERIDAGRIALFGSSAGG